MEDHQARFFAREKSPQLLSPERTTPNVAVIIPFGGDEWREKVRILERNLCLLGANPGFKFHIYLFVWSNLKTSLDITERLSVETLTKRYNEGLMLPTLFLTLPKDLDPKASAIPSTIVKAQSANSENRVKSEEELSKARKDWKERAEQIQPKERIYPKSSAEFHVLFKSGITGQFLRDYATHQKIKCDYYIIMLDDVEIVSPTYPLSFMLHTMKEHSVDILSPRMSPQTGKANINWWFMYLATKNMKPKDLCFVNFIERFHYIMTADSYDCYVSLIDENMAWLWGVDLCLHPLGFTLAVFCGLEYIHHFKRKKPTTNNKHNPFREMEYVIKRFESTFNIKHIKHTEYKVIGLKHLW